MPNAAVYLCAYCLSPDDADDPALSWRHAQLAPANAHIPRLDRTHPLTIDPLESVLQQLEAAIRTQDDARQLVGLLSSVRRVIATEPSPSWTWLHGRDANEQQLLDIVDEWRHASATFKARLVNALDLWLTRVRLEWNIDQDT
jgi:hypothetical protein